MRKKFWSIVLCIAMVLSLCSFAVGAEGTEETPAPVDPTQTTEVVNEETPKDEEPKEEVKPEEEVKPSEEAKPSEEVKEKTLYEKILACTTYEQVQELVAGKTDRELDEYFSSLTEEQQSALNQHIDAIEAGDSVEEQQPEDENPLTEISENKDTAVGPIVNPATGVPSSADNGIVGTVKKAVRKLAAGVKNLFSGTATYGVDSEDDRITTGKDSSTHAEKDGLVLDKSITQDENGNYTINLETYATGNITISDSTVSVPCDIVLVIDQSGSMSNNFNSTTYSYNKYTETGLEGLKTQSNNNDTDTYGLYVKAGDEYKQVTVKIEKRISGYSAYSANTKNSTYWSNKDKLYYKTTDGEYEKVALDRDRDYFWQDYEYTYVYGENSTTSTGKNSTVSGVTFYEPTYTNYYIFTYIGTDGQTVTSEQTTKAPDWTFYTRKSTVSSQPRLDALKAAANKFIASVEEKAKGEDGIAGTADDVNHRIAVVGFSSGGYGNTELLTGVTITKGRDDYGTTPGNAWYFPTGYQMYGANYSDGITTQQYGSALQSTNTEAGKTNISDAIDALTAYGGTQTQTGMDMANNIFKNNDNRQKDSNGSYVKDENGNYVKNRNRAVVVFTDGEPGNQGFEKSVANSAIGYAKTAKQVPTESNDNTGYGATIYSIGIFEDADNSAVTGNTLNANKFMHAISSNYINASSMDYLGDRTIIDGSTPQYYQYAGDSDKLNSIFESIANQATSGGTTVTLDKNAVVRDVLSNELKLPDGVSASDIKVYTAACTGKVEGGSFTFSTETSELTDAVPSISGKTINVSGYDFKSNAATETNSNGTKTYSGCKLIVKIPVTLDNTFGGNQIKTNTDTAGIYLGDKNYGLFESPKINVDLDYRIASQDKTIYATNSTDIKNLLAYANGYTPDGKNNAYVDIVYTLKDGETIKGYYKIPAGESIGTWYSDSSCTTKIDAIEVAPMSCTQYTLNCTLTPTQSGSVSAESTDAATPTVHVLTPANTWNDTTVYLGATTNKDIYNKLAAADVTWSDKDGIGGSAEGDVPATTYSYKNGEEDADVNKQFSDCTALTPVINVGSQGYNQAPFTVHVLKPTVTWKDSDCYFGDTFPTSFAPVNVEWSDTDGGASNETAPVLSYTPTYDVTNGIMPNADVPVNITSVTADGTVYSDEMLGKVTFINGSDSHSANTENTPEFTVHPKTCSLTIQKQGAGDAYGTQSFVFKVEGNNSVYKVDTSVTVQGNGKVTLTGLPVGTYTVTEDGGWSWRYTQTSSNSPASLSKDASTATVSIVNALTNNKWLSGNAAAVNKWTDSGVSNILNAIKALFEN